MKEDRIYSENLARIKWLERFRGELQTTIEEINRELYALRRQNEGIKGQWLLQGARVRGEM